MSYFGRGCISIISVFIIRNFLRRLSMPLPYSVLNPLTGFAKADLSVW
jgi:hypothetical protein